MISKKTYERILGIFTLTIFLSMISFFGYVLFFYEPQKTDRSKVDELENSTPLIITHPNGKIGIEIAPGVGIDPDTGDISNGSGF